MSEQFLVDVPVLARLVRRVFPEAISVSVEPVTEGRLLVLYRARIDGAAFYLRLAEEPGEDLSTDAGVLGRLRSLGVLVPVVVAAEASPAELARSYMMVTEIPGQSLARAGTDDEPPGPPGPQPATPPSSTR